MFLDEVTRKTNRSIRSYQRALDYLASRHISSDEIDKFKIGYSRIISVPDDGTDDYRRFYAEIIKRRKFEEKVLFPILDPIGRSVGMVSRSIDRKEYIIFALDEAKYTGFFFGLYQALPHIYETGVVYVTEGVFDAIALASVFPNSVAALTAELNENQYELLRFYCKKIILVFDSDKAGRTGTINALETYKDVVDVNIGYKDISKCRSTFNFSNFKSFIQGKVNRALYQGVFK